MGSRSFRAISGFLEPEPEALNLNSVSLTLDTSKPYAGAERSQKVAGVVGFGF